MHLSRYIIRMIPHTEDLVGPLLLDGTHRLDGLREGYVFVPPAGTPHPICGFFILSEWEKATWFDDFETAHIWLDNFLGRSPRQYRLSCFTIEHIHLYGVTELTNQMLSDFENGNIPRTEYFFPARR